MPCGGICRPYGLQVTWFHVPGGKKIFRLKLRTILPKKDTTGLRVQKKRIFRHVLAVLCMTPQEETCFPETS